MQQCGGSGPPNMVYCEVHTLEVRGTGKHALVARSLHVFMYRGRILASGLCVGVSVLTLLS